VMEAHYTAHRSMPLAAFDDLLASLAAHGALAGGGARSARERTWLSRWLSPRTLWREEQEEEPGKPRAEPGDRGSSWGCGSRQHEGERGRFLPRRVGAGVLRAHR
jgi:hypothetical protein